MLRNDLSEKILSYKSDTRLCQSIHEFEVNVVCLVYNLNLKMTT